MVCVGDCNERRTQMTAAARRRHHSHRPHPGQQTQRGLRGTHTLSPRTRYSPSASTSTPDFVENTRSWQSARMRLVAWS